MRNDAVNDHPKWNETGNARKNWNIFHRVHNEERAVGGFKRIRGSVLGTRYLGALWTCRWQERNKSNPTRLSDTISCSRWGDKYPVRIENEKDDRQKHNHHHHQSNKCSLSQCRGGGWPPRQPLSYPRLLRGLPPHPGHRTSTAVRGEKISCYLVFG